VGSAARKPATLPREGTHPCRCSLAVLLSLIPSSPTIRHAKAPPAKPAREQKRTTGGPTVEEPKVHAADERPQLPQRDYTATNRRRTKPDARPCRAATARNELRNACANKKRPIKCPYLPSSNPKCKTKRTPAVTRDDDSYGKNNNSAYIAIQCLSGQCGFTKRRGSHSTAFAPIRRPPDIRRSPRRDTESVGGAHHKTAEGENGAATRGRAVGAWSRYTSGRFGRRVCFIRTEEGTVSCWVRVGGVCCRWWRAR